MNRHQFEITSWSAAELAARIRARDVSPSEAVEAALARIEACNPRVNAVCTVAADQAMTAARAAERLLERDQPLPPLLGVPVGIKDITPTAGIRTTYGSPLCRDHVPAEDAEVVARLKAAGAIVIGKTNTPEFAAGANTVNPVFGATRNPWNPALSAGGSTGGGAAALATGMIALAQGTDLGGSLRNPAAFCGVVGLRPTPGVVPSAPNPAPWDTLQVDGPMARSAEDCWLALRAMAGLSRRTPVSTVMAQAADDTLAPALPRRIAYVADIAGYGIDPEIADCCRSAAFALRDAGCEVEEIELDLSAGHEVFLALRGAVIVSQLWPYLDRIEELGENLRGNVRYGLGVGTAQLAAAQHRRQALWQQVMALLERYPLLLTPCTPVLPFPVEQNYPDQIAGRPMRSYIDWVAPTFLLSLLGMPVASVPAGLGRSGLPIGLQILGAPFAERQVLSAAAAVQACRPVGLAPASGAGAAA